LRVTARSTSEGGCDPAVKFTPLKKPCRTAMGISKIPNIYVPTGRRPRQALYQHCKKYFKCSIPGKALNIMLRREEHPAS
jgi:hypothetical protein